MRYVMQRCPGGMLVCVLLLVGLAGCGPFDKTTITTPRDTSAGNLDASFTLGPTQYPDKLAVSAAFLYHDVPVRFTRGEHVVCNGMTLAFTTNTFDAYLPNLPQNRSASCAYVDAAGVATTVVITMPQTPVILSPKAGATVPRSKSFVLTYAPQTVQQVQLDVDTYIKADTLTGFTCLASVGNGSITCDTTTIPAGKGTITLNMQVNTTLDRSGFHVAHVASDASTVIPIVWA